MPCSSSLAEQEFYARRIQRDGFKALGLNVDGSDLDFLTSLLCAHLRHLQKHMIYEDFIKLVQPHVIEWFKNHCKGEE